MPLTRQQIPDVYTESDGLSHRGEQLSTRAQSRALFEQFALRAFCLVVVSGGLLLVNGCGSAVPPERADEPETREKDVAPEPNRGTSFLGAVVGVADGDTIDVVHDGRSVPVRIYGVDAPERGDPYSDAAKKFTSDLVYGQEVQVDVVTTDRYNRLVAHVTLSDGRNVSSELVANGLAWWFRKYAPDDRELARLEGEARARRLGLWADPSPIPPWEARKSSNGSPSVNPAVSQTPAAKSPSSQEGPIIGNRNSMIYHRPDCPDYEKVSERNRVYFSSTTEAEAAGFRPARNCP